MFRILAPAMVAVALVAAGPARADDDDCRSPMSQWQPRDVALQHAETLGISVNRLKIDDGCYEIRGNDSDGNRIELKLDPASLALMELEVKFRAGSSPSRYVAGARGQQSGPVQAPADNPLFAPGSAPRVQDTGRGPQ